MFCHHTDRDVRKLLMSSICARVRVASRSTLSSKLRDLSFHSCRDLLKFKPINGVISCFLDEYRIW